MIKLSLVSFALIMLGTALVSASFGFLLAGVMVSGKLQELYARLDKAEARASDQAQAVAGLSDALSSLLVALKSESGKLLDQGAIRRAESILRIL